MPEKSAKNTATTTEPAECQDFEGTLSELEKVVVQLEGELKLQDALKLFERGIGLSTQLERYLQSAEQKIEVLKKAAGTVTTQPLSDS